MQNKLKKVVLPTIVPRPVKSLGLELETDIPKYWFGGDVFKTRLFDAMSTLFPVGERFFIACVRDFRNEIVDPTLKQAVADFIRQEAQHGVAHEAFNNRLTKQGINVAKIEQRLSYVLNLVRQRASAKFTLAETAALEHFTAMMAHEFISRKSVFADADPRVRAMYSWHAIEEIEHKAVAYDVMKNVAKVGYMRRVFAMQLVTFLFVLHVTLIMRHIFRVDGLKGREWFRICVNGLCWLAGKDGIVWPLVPHYFTYFKPGFHPWQVGRMETYVRWLRSYNQHQNAQTAANDMLFDEKLAV